MPEKATAEIIKTMSDEAPIEYLDFYEYSKCVGNPTMRVINGRNVKNHIDKFLFYPYNSW
jgi:hypothetical protein